MSDIRDMVQDAIATQPWIVESPGLPMIGLGGTIRTLGKMSRKRNKYPLQLAHNYVLKPDELHYFLTLLSSLPLEKRKKIDGLTKERADIMVPGLIILETIFNASKASSCVISGSGLRDGLFFETFNPKQPIKPDVLEASIQNVLALHPNAALMHVQQVDTFAMQLYDTLAPSLDYDSRCKKYLHTAALLHRIGVSVHYYQYLKHTQYMMPRSAYRRPQSSRDRYRFPHRNIQNKKSDPATGSYVQGPVTGIRHGINREVRDFASIS